MTFNKKVIVSVGALLTASAIFLGIHEEHYGESTANEPVEVKVSELEIKEFLEGAVVEQALTQVEKADVEDSYPSTRILLLSEILTERESSVEGSNSEKRQSQKIAYSKEKVVIKEERRQAEQDKHIERTSQTVKEDQERAEQQKRAEQQNAEEAKRQAAEQARRNEQAVQEAARQEAERQEAIRQEAARQEAERLEAERQAEIRQAEEALRLEAERQAAEAQRQAEEQARVAEEEARAAEEARKFSEPNMLIFGGTAIPLIDCQGAGAAPYGDLAGIWTGSGSTIDGAPSHFIGHNPGVFTGLLSLGIGSEIRVNDRDGNSRSYIVRTMMEVDDFTCDANGYDHWDELFSRGGENISLQTCLGDNWNLILIAE